MIETCRKIWKLLSRRERWQFGLVFVAMTVAAGLQVTGIASVAPFLTVAADPGSVQDNAWLAWGYNAFGFESTQQFLIGLGFGALAVVAVGNALIVFTRWVMFRWMWHRHYVLSSKLFTKYLSQPYAYFLTRNSSKLKTLVLSEVKEMVTGVIKPVLQAMARGIVALFVIGFLFYIDPVLALIVTVVLGGAYGVLYTAVRQWLRRIGEARVQANQDRFSVANEVFGAVKDVKLLGKEEVFADRYRTPTREHAIYRTWSDVVSQAPKYLFEAVAFGGIILIAVYLLWVGGEMQEIIPILGMYTFAGYRLMPALQVMFRGVSKLRFNAPAVDKVYQDMTEYRYASAMRSNDKESSKAERQPLRERLSLEDVTFRYPDGEAALRDVSCTVEARTTVGIVGPSGAGKTTLVDLVLGLFLPQEGKVRVDDTPLTPDNVRAWQRTIGYVPQEINLADTTVSRNIAYGEPEDAIDMGAVRRAARSASIHEFVRAELSEGYDTVVGEEGVRLSGGQRQRIGIARALYRDPEMLIFDEATSSVDTATERQIMESIYQLSGEKTILVIAHRTKTLERCDKILEIEEGELVGERGYQEIVGA